MPNAKDYKERVESMRGLVGNEAGTHNFFAALAELNRDSDLKMNADDLFMMGMVYSALGQTSRFAQENHLAERYHSNSATHSLFSIIRMDETVRRAVEDYGAVPGPDLTLTSRTAARGLLMHDAGEVLGEISSLAQIVAHPERKKDIPEIERMVTEYALKRAEYAIENHDMPFFLDGIVPLREKFDAIRESGNVPDAKTFQALLDTQRVPAISASGEERVKKWMQYYDLAETQNTFITHFIKSSEHVQGTRHLLRFGEKDAMSLKFASSKRMLANPRYTESNLGDMFEAAQTSNELALAKSTRDIIYKSAIEIFGRGPKEITRILPGEGELPQGSLQVSRQPNRSRSSKASHGDGGDQLRDTESSEHIKQLYAYAIAQDYKPKPGEILATVKSLPAALIGFSAPESDRAHAR